MRYSENDFYDLVREVAGDLVEQVCTSPSYAEDIDRDFTGRLRCLGNFFNIFQKTSINIVFINNVKLFVTILD